MLEVCSVTKRFGRFTAVENITFQVEPGSVYGMVGYNGAGKTTLLKTISGVYRPEGGEVRLDGEKVFDNPKQKQKMFFVPDELYFPLGSNMKKMASFYRDYYPKFSQNTFLKLAEAFGLDIQKKVQGFSKGMQRQAETVLAMATQPQVLLLDESFDGLDPAKRNVVRQMLIEYVNEREASVVISSHNLPELSDLCDKVGLIDGKHLVMNCDVSEIGNENCKFRILFDREITPAELEGIPYSDYQQEGKRVTLLVKGDLKEARAKLDALHPLLVEEFPLTLEEVFLNEMGGSSYDFKEIFQ